MFGTETALRTRIALIALFCASWFAGAAAAQTNSRMAQCEGSDPAGVIPACTAVITSAQSSHDLVSLALSNRAIAYEKLGQNDRAMTDLDEAIKRDPKN